MFKGPTGLGGSPRNRSATASSNGSTGSRSRDTSQVRKSKDMSVIIDEEDEPEDDNVETPDPSARDMDHVEEAYLSAEEEPDTDKDRLQSVTEPRAGMADLEEGDEDMEVEEVDTFSPMPSASESLLVSDGGYFGQEGNNDEPTQHSRPATAEDSPVRGPTDHLRKLSGGGMAIIERVFTAGSRGSKEHNAVDGD